MHIVIAFLTALAGVIWALFWLQNAGVNLNSFNPFYWARRRAWEKKLGTRPLHGITDPMEAAAVLVVAMAEQRGTVTRELKEKVIAVFAAEFNSSERQAAELFAASSYLLREAVNVPDEARHILQHSLAQYEPRHRESLLSMLRTVAGFEGEPTESQKALLKNVQDLLSLASRNDKTW